MEKGGVGTGVLETVAGGRGLPIKSVTFSVLCCPLLAEDSAIFPSNSHHSRWGPLLGSQNLSCCFQGLSL